MSKVVQAVNAMISHPDKITNVLRGVTGETFFRYDKKHKWSMAKREDGYHLWYYPGDERLEQLASYEGPEWDETPLVYYKAADIGTKEATESFADLYRVIHERMFGMDGVLNDI